MASCKNTWETFQHVRRERLLLIAITEADCPRLPLHEALTVTINCVRTVDFLGIFHQISRRSTIVYFIQVPRIRVGVELPQIILDIRAARSVNWRSVTVLYDEIFGERLKLV